MSSEEIKELQECIEVIDMHIQQGTATERQIMLKELYQQRITELVGKASYERVLRYQLAVIVVLSGLLLVCLMAFQDPETIQAQFTDMSADERSEFMTWAMTDEMTLEVCR